MTSSMRMLNDVTYSRFARWNSYIGALCVGWSPKAECAKVAGL